MSQRKTWNGKWELSEGFTDKKASTTISRSVLSKVMRINK